MLETLSPIVRVLELGVGQGGAHLRSTLSGQYYAIDNDDYDNGVDLRELCQEYPGVYAIKASAQHLPFAAGVFSRLESRLPCGSLLVPGLQAKWRMDSRLKLQLPFLSYLYPLCESSSRETSWYQEFARVLKDEGELIIWGDRLVDERMIANQAAPYFALMAVRGLTTDEIRRMGTICSQSMVGDLGKGRVPSVTEVKQITLRRL